MITPEDCRSRPSARTNLSAERRGNRLLAVIALVSIAAHLPAWADPNSPEPTLADIYKDGSARPFESDRAERETVVDRVYFATASAELRSEALSIIEQQARWLQRNPAVQVVVEGHADSRGSRAANMRLAARRAQAVRAQLVRLGVPASRVGARSFGEDRPRALGSSSPAYRSNRSAQTVIVDCSAPSNPEDLPKLRP